jgi:ribosomal protein S18 acetylase RimI-like enzyme
VSGWSTHTRVLRAKHGLEILVRPLRNGDERTVTDVFDRLGDESRRRRFNGSKPSLGEMELRWLAAVDATRHALVAYVAGDPRPVAIARLARIGSSAEIAFAVADEYHRRGIGVALTAELVADARAARITEITAIVSTENQAAVALLRRVLRVLDIRLVGPELSIRAPLVAPSL